jgi:hypothetical protein
MMGPEPETECGEVRVTLCTGVLAHEEVTVGLMRRLACGSSSRIVIAAEWLHQVSLEFGEAWREDAI